jgi:hypothetical protein
MRILSMSAVAVLFVATVAAAQDTARNAPKEQTLAGWHGFQALHVDFGGVSRSTVDSGLTLGVARLTAAFSSLPQWSFSFLDQEGYGQRGSYTVPNSGGYQPPMYQSIQGLAAEHRWNNRRAIHLFAAVSAGSITNSFEYYHDSAGVRENHRDEKKSTPYLAMDVGGELNIAHWIRYSISVGYRNAAKYTFSTGSMRNDGVTVTSLIELGKF